MAISFQTGVCNSSIEEDWQSQQQLRLTVNSRAIKITSYCLVPKDFAANNDIFCWSKNADFIKNLDSAYF